MINDAKVDMYGEFKSNTYINTISKRTNTNMTIGLGLSVSVILFIISAWVSLR